MRRFAPALAAWLAVLAAASCGGGGGGAAETEAGETVGAEAAQALVAIRADDLRLMTLPPEEFGADAQGLDVDVERSGFSDNKEAAADTFDPKDSAADLKKRGRLTGYDLIFADADLSSLQAGEGVVEASSSLDLFADAGSASAFLKKQLEDFERFEGEDLDGLVFNDVESFRVEEVGDEATGVTARSDLDDSALYVTAVSFRVGRLLAVALEARADDADVRTQMASIARSLEQRIEDVLLGAVTSAAVTLPDEEPGPGSTGAAEGPDVAEMALSLDDLPAGISVSREGYVDDEQTVASYAREFDLDKSRIGASLFTTLESDVNLFESAADASLVLSGVKGAFTSGSPEDLFLPFVQNSGFDASNFRIEIVATPELGDDSVSVRSTFETPEGGLVGVFVFVRVDRAAASLFIVGPEGEVAIDDVVVLAEAMVSRMRTELAE